MLFRVYQILVTPGIYKRLIQVKYAGLEIIILCDFLTKKSLILTLASNYENITAQFLCFILTNKLSNSRRSLSQKGDYELLQFFH